MAKANGGTMSKVIDPQPSPLKGGKMVWAPTKDDFMSWTEAFGPPRTIVLRIAGAHFPGITTADEKVLQNDNGEWVVEARVS